MSLYRKVTVNGVERLEDLAGTYGSGLPCGTLIDLDTNDIVPNGYLKCDGSYFDTTLYPELAMHLDSDRLPTIYDTSSMDVAHPDWYAQYANASAYQGTGAEIKSSSNACFPQYAEADGVMNVNADDGSFLVIHHYDTTDSVYVLSERDNVDGYLRVEIKKGDTFRISYPIETPVNRDYTRVAIWYYKRFRYIKATSGITEVAATAVYNDIKDYVDGKPTSYTMDFDDSDFTSNDYQVFKSKDSIVTVNGKFTSTTSIATGYSIVGWLNAACDPGKTIYGTACYEQYSLPCRILHDDLLGCAIDIKTPVTIPADATIQLNITYLT